MAYCGRCRIGTVGADGLCVLCGASQEPETARTRLAEAGASFLSALLGPVGLTVAALLLVAGGIGFLTQSGFHAPAGMARFPGMRGMRMPDLAHAGAGGIAAFFLGPAILQFVILLIIILAIYLFMRLRRGRPSQAAETY
jgi:hypothetical protein